MKQTILLICTFAILSIAAQAQTVFSETFGQTTVRQTSAYMPSGSFNWGAPSGTIDQKAIENNHYAVVAPANIRDAYPVPFYWFWTGPQPTVNRGGSANNPIATDHTGNANGAVMVVNGGSTLNVFYQRQVTLVPGNSYRLSFFMYLVNSSSIVKFGVRDAATKSILGSTTTGFISLEDRWVQYTYNFTYPSSCAAGGSIETFLSNDLSAFNGNDYYIDDIVLQTIAGPAANLSCLASTVLPVQLLSFDAAINNCTAQIQWKSATEITFDRYELEYSNNGINYNTITTVQGKGDNSSYRAQHKPGNGNAFYRLKMTDWDNRFEYSNVVRIRQQCSEEKVVLYPTVLHQGESLSIYGADLSKGATVQFYSTAGTLVHTQNVNAGDNRVIVNRLMPGLYLVKLTGSNLNQTKKVLIK